MPLFQFWGKETSVEFNLIPLSRLPDFEWPGEDAVEAFLNALSNTPGLREVGENLRSSHYTTRRPNVSLVALEEDSLRRGLCAIRLLQASGSVSKPRSGE